jgi:hypothetical protein
MFESNQQSFAANMREMPTGHKDVHDDCEVLSG